MPYHTITIPATVGSAETGEIRMWAGAAADIPDGYLLCDGSAISRTQYTKLYQIIGDAYGAGDGSTTFNLPDLSGRAPIGSNSDHALGDSGGEETHTLTIDEMPSHTHGALTHANAASGTHLCSNNGNGTANQIQTGVIFPTGGGQSHNNMQPYLTINFIIKT